MDNKKRKKKIISNEYRETKISIITPYYNCQCRRELIFIILGIEKVGDTYEILHSTKYYQN